MLLELMNASVTSLESLLMAIWHLNGAQLDVVYAPIVEALKH
jgi:hypothetical protein